MSNKWLLLLAAAGVAFLLFRKPKLTQAGLYANVKRFSLLRS